ncbi:MAG: sulfite exporter TauE/SafE family protein [Myxococcales bacterium]|nr:sulfite exporter TauE/SafE family protein [Myxococcales bacterium]
MTGELLTALDARLPLVAVATLVAGFMRGFVGFGAALITIPVLSYAFGPLVAVPSGAVMALPTTLQLLPDAIRHGERAVVVPIAIAAFTAAPLGAWLLVSIDPALMKIVISSLVISMVAMLARGWTLAGPASVGVLVAAGGAGGLVQGAAGIGGPPVVAVVLSRPGPAVQQRGNVLAVMTVISLPALVPLWYHGLFTREAVLIGATLVPLSLISTWVGSRYFSTGGQRHFRRAALGVLAVVGVATFVEAVHDYLARDTDAAPVAVA